MRTANLQAKSDRRDEILNAARTCFAEAGFHQTSMQQICAAAGMSPGNLYRYFPSKEAIIAGICERDRAMVAGQLASVASSTDFWTTFAQLARHHVVERSQEEVGLCAEIMTESRRNETIGSITRTFEKEVREQLIGMLRAAAARGDVDANADLEAAVTMLMVIVDGVWWRRAVDPQFDAQAVLPLFLDITKHMLAPKSARSNVESIR